MRVPNAPKTPLRCFRVPTELYEAVKVIAKEQDRSISDVVRGCMMEFVRNNSGDEPEPTGDRQS